MPSRKNTIKLIYNPNAGKKRHFAGGGNGITLEKIKAILQQYQLQVDYAPTRAPKHATVLAKESIAEGYETVLAAGGDGTVNEVANGLIGSNVTLGIIPMGTFMNIAHMLSLPMDIEKAILVIKLHRVRKIDVGVVTKLEGEKLSEPFYFLESSGIGLDAHIQLLFKKLEKGQLLYIAPLVQNFLRYSLKKTTIETEDKSVTYRASIVTVANGPFSGANLKIAPDAKLNDHRLTVAVYKMTQWELLKYFVRMRVSRKIDKRRLLTFKAKKVKISTKHTELLVHVDASLFGTTPVHFTVKPNALNVICGFPVSGEEASLAARTILDP